MNKKLYRIIATAPSAFAFPEHQGLVFGNEVPKEDDPVVRVAVSTVWQGFPPLSMVPLPVAIQLTADVWASNLDEVVPLADEVLIGFVDTLAVCVNAAIGVPQAQCIFDIEPPDRNRELREYFRPIDYPMARPIRCQSPDLLHEPLRSLYLARQSYEIGLAIAHYKAALSFFGTSQLIFAFESLCIATEILGEPFVQRELNRRSMPINNKSVKRLAKELGHYSTEDPVSNWRNRLYDDILVRMIFESDRDLYKKVGKGTNGFEHGSMPPTEIRSIAQETIQRLFILLRRAFFDLAELDSISMNQILPWAPVGLDPVRDHIDVKFTSVDESVDEAVSGPSLAPTLGMAQKIVAAEIVEDYLRIERSLRLQPDLGIGTEVTDIQYSMSSPYNVLGTAKRSSPGPSATRPS